MAEHGWTLEDMLGRPYFLSDGMRIQAKKMVEEQEAGKDHKGEED